MTICSMEVGERHMWVDVSSERRGKREAALVFWGHWLLWEKILILSTNAFSIQDFLRFECSLSRRPGEIRKLK